MRVEAEAGRALFAFLRFRGDVLDVGHAKLAALGIKRNRAGEPADGNQPEQFGFARLELENGDGILRAIADEQFFARPVERQRIRLRAEQIARILPRAESFHHLVAARVNHAQRVGTRAGRDDPAAIR